jgi:hypothetical protein
MKMTHSILIAKFKTSIEVPDFETLPDATKEYIIEYGMRQSLNDRVAGETDLKEGMALVQKRLDGWIAGTVRAMGTREVDPVKTESKRLALVAVKNAIREKGKKIADFEDQLPDLVDAYLAKHPETMDAAKANVDARKSAVKVDLDELLG